MKRAKKYALTLLCLVLVLSSLPLAVFGARPDWGGNWGGGSREDNEEEPFEYEVSEKELVSKGLSVISVNTDSGDYVKSRLEYVPASMKITLSEEFKKCTNAYTESALPIEIKGRGNSTWNNGYSDGKQNTLPGDTHTRKVPYNIKLSEKANLFGMGERKSWVLVANYMDRSNLRNKLIYDLSANMGMIYTKSVFVNLMLNGEYMGVYMLCQKIDEELFEGKVTDWNEVAEDFAKGISAERGYTAEELDALEEELKRNLGWLTKGYYSFEGERTKYYLSSFVDTKGLSLQHGYLIEYDGYADEDSFFTTPHNVPLKIKNMEFIKSNDEIFSYVRDYFTDFEEALYSDTFYNTKGKHYSEYIDIDSFVDYYILNALILNVEFGYKSMFMYMNSDGKLVLGPCWDYDWSSGNPFLGANGEFDKWYNDGRAGNNHWYRQLYGDPYFVGLVKERWFDVTKGIEDMIDSMDYYYEYLSDTVEIEYDKFSSDPYERDFAHRTGGRSFEQEYLMLKSFLENRYEWMGEMFLFRDPNIENRGYKADTSYPVTVTGNGVSLTAGVPGESVSDLVCPENTDLTVKVQTSVNNTYSFYLNGIFIEKIKADKSGEISLKLDKDKLIKGFNAVCVLRNVSDDLQRAEGVAYISFDMPGDKRPAVTLGRVEANTDPKADKPAENEPVSPENETGENDKAPSKNKEPDGKNGTLVAVIVLAIAAISCAAGGYLYKKRKNKSNINENTEE